VVHEVTHYNELLTITN